MDTERMTDDKNLLPSEAAEKLTLTELEELALKHMEADNHIIRHRGQVEVARELRSIAFSNIQDLMFEDENGVLRLHDLKKLPRDVTASIKKIKIKRDRIKGPRTFDDEGNLIPNHTDMTGEVLEIELWDKTGSLDKLMRHYGGYNEDNKQKAQEGAAANLDLLMGAIASQGLPQLINDPLEDQPLTEDDI